MSIQRTQPIIRRACAVVTVPSSVSRTSPIFVRTYASKTPLSAEPLPQPKPIYPPPSNPFQPPPDASPSSSSSQQTGQQHSAFKVSIVKALAKLMGYNSRSVTAIRETGNMVGSIVRAVEKDHDFWYQGEGESRKVDFSSAWLADNPAVL
jgi:cytochrome b pre-mRNA-processing protein 3